MQVRRAEVTKQRMSNQPCRAQSHSAEISTAKKPALLERVKLEASRQKCEISQPWEDGGAGLPAAKDVASNAFSTGPSE
jgi:hypothetical protein